MDPACKHSCRGDGPADTDASRLSLAATELAAGAGIAVSPPLGDERAIYVLQGVGEVDIDGRRRRVAAGDALRLAPGARFGLRNTAADAVLVFLTATPPALPVPAAEGPLATAAARLAWLLRRIARRLSR